MFTGKDIAKLFGMATPTIQDFVISYMKKDAKTDNLTWLGTQLAKHLPDVPIGAAMQMGQEISSSIGRFSANMNAIHAACEEGRTKAEWLRDYLESNMDEETMQERGEYLYQVNENLAAGNAVAMDPQKNFEDMINITEEALNETTQPSGIEWNKYNMQELVDSIGQQAALAGMNGISLPVDPSTLQGMQGMANTLPPEMIEQTPSEALDGGVKMAAAAALQFLAKTKKIPILSKLFPVGAITDIACWGVEGAKCIGKCALGKMTATQAMEHMKRASVVAMANLITSGLAPKLFCAIPVVGVPLSYAASLILPNMASEQIQQKLYEGVTMVTDVATEMAQGIADTAKNAMNSVKNSVAAVLGVEA